MIYRFNLPVVIFLLQLRQITGIIIVKSKWPEQSPKVLGLLIEMAM